MHQLVMLIPVSSQVPRCVHHIISRNLLNVMLKSLQMLHTMPSHKLCRQVPPQQAVEGLSCLPAGRRRPHKLDLSRQRATAKWELCTLCGTAIAATGQALCGTKDEACGFSPAFLQLLCLLQLQSQHECCFCLLSQLLRLIRQRLLGSSQLLAGGLCYPCGLLCCQLPGLHL